MSAIFASLGKTITAGFVILIVIILAMGGVEAKLGEHVWWAFVFRWLHVM